MAGRLFQEVLRRTHLSAPSDLPSVVAQTAAHLGAMDARLFVVDHEQEHLLLWGAEGATESPPLPIEGSVHGRAFAASTIIQLSGEAPGIRRLLLPLLDGTDRVGVMELVLSVEETLDEHLVALSERYAHFVAQLIITKSAYGDAFEVRRRTRPMDVSAELMWQLLPPRVFASDDVVLAGLVEPCYASGGDCFDYAVNGRIAHLAIFDAMGHGLVACGASSLAVSAYRSARRRELGLVDTYVEMDLAVRRQDADRHVTAVIAELDLNDGRLRWVNAGHPEPLLLRHGKVVKTLRGPVQTPLGIPFSVGPVAEASESLEPGDQLLLYTDGLPEARQPDGEFLTVERLESSWNGRLPPDTRRRRRYGGYGTPSWPTNMGSSRTTRAPCWLSGGEGPNVACCRRRCRRNTARSTGVRAAANHSALISPWHDESCDDTKCPDSGHAAACAGGAGAGGDRARAGRRGVVHLPSRGAHGSATDERVQSSAGAARGWDRRG
jgi:hypothetical protein